MNKLLGVARRDRLRNEYITSALVGIRMDIVQKLQVRRLKYFGRGPEMTSMPVFPRIHDRVDDKSCRSCPQKWWTDVIEKDCVEVNVDLVEAVRATDDRGRWRSALMLSERI